MSTGLSFNRFGNVSHRKKNQTKGGSRTRRSSTMELFVTIQYKEVIWHWQSSCNLNDEGIVKLPLYDITFNFHEKIGGMGGEKNPEDSSISHIGFLFLFLVRGKITYYFLYWEMVPFEISICILAFLQSSIWIYSLILEILE